MSCRLSIVEDHVGPELRSLLDNAVAAGAVREGVDALDLLIAVSSLCAPHPGTDNISRAHRMVALLLDGLRYGARGSARPRADRQVHVLPLARRAVVVCVP